MKHGSILIGMVALLVLNAGTICAQGPNGSGTYYQAADGKKGAELKTSLSEVVYNRNEGGSLDAAYKEYNQPDVIDTLKDSVPGSDTE